MARLGNAMSPSSLLSPEQEVAENEEIGQEQGGSGWEESRMGLKWLRFHLQAHCPLVE